MALSKISTSIFRTTSKEIRALNAAIDQYNAQPGEINLERIEKMIEAPGRAFWISKASEITRLEMEINRARPEVTRAVKADIAGVKVMGDTGVVNHSPSRWIDTLSALAPSLDGVGGERSGKAGAQGNTRVLELLNGKKLFAKTDHSNDKNHDETECQREYGVYKKLYETAGGHPNLVIVWGWADLRMGNLHEVGIVMDYIKGPDGRTMQAQLKEAWDLGIISSAEYWSSIQYIGRCHVKVIQHLKSAGWVHNDIKPENYVVDSESGEVIVIDLGGAGLLGDRWNAVTAQYLAPEMLVGDRPDRGAKGTTASDVFSLGASIAHAAEAAHAFHVAAKPNRGLTSKAVPFHQVNTAVEGLAAGRYKNPFEYGAETDYTRQLRRMMNENPLEREKTIDEHDASNRFLNDSILNDHETREVLKGIASGSRKKSWESKWLRSNQTPPTSMTVDRVSLTTLLKNKMRNWKLQPLFVPEPRQMTMARTMVEEADVKRKRSQLEEIAKLIKQANAFGINTTIESAIIEHHLKHCDIMEGLIKGGAERHHLQTLRPRR